MTTTFNFSGHESFACRQFWPKKGYDFIKEGHRFSSNDAIVQLGVGKNMVTSIQFWMRSFGLLDESTGWGTEIASYLFGEGGRDPFLEDVGTLWILHYLLVATGKASIYQLVFNEYRKQRLEFTRDQLAVFLDRKCQESEQEVRHSTLRSDVDVFMRTYLRPNSRTRNPEDDFLALLIDLDLVQSITRAKMDGGPLYRIESKDRDTLPSEVVLFAILQQNVGLSLSFSRLMADPDNVGSVFALNRDGLQRHLEYLAQRIPNVTFSDDAGIKELQFMERPDPFEVLDIYYNA